MTSNALIVVHKYIRRELFDCATRLACAGPEDVAVVWQAFDALGALLEEHATKEDAAIAPALDEATGARMRADHVLLEDQFAQLQRQLAQLTERDAASREAQLAALCLAFHAFVAAYLTHLDDEERTMLPLLGERVPPIAMLASNAAMLPADERSAFLDKLYACIAPVERRAIEQAVATALGAAA